MIALLLALTAHGADWPDVTADLPRSSVGTRDAALVVGIEDYAFIPGVAGARKNADDWYRYLTRGRGVPTARVHLLRDSEATVEKIRRAAADVASEVEGGGTLWVVFVGHGAPTLDGSDGMLVGADAQQDADSMFARSLPQAELLDLTGAGAQAHTVAVIDSCFSERSPSGDALVSDLQFAIPAYASEQPADVTILTAGHADQFAGPLPGARRPAFTYLVLGALRGWGDADGDGVVTAGEARDYAADALNVLVTDRSQTPELRGGENVELGQGREEGPDLAEMVLARQPVGGGVRFGGTTVRVPEPTQVVSSAGLAGLDLQAERLMEAALEAQEDEWSSPTVKRDAWCALHRHDTGHAYAEAAADACAAWTTYVDDLATLEAGLAEDYAKLAGFLALERQPVEARLAATQSFLDAYHHLDDDKRVRAATRARDRLEAGKTAHLDPNAGNRVQVTTHGIDPAALAAITPFQRSRPVLGLGAGFAWGMGARESTQTVWYGGMAFVERTFLHAAIHVGVGSTGVELTLSPAINLLSWPRWDNLRVASPVNLLVGPTVRWQSSPLGDDALSVGVSVADLMWLTNGIAVRMGVDVPVVGDHGLQIAVGILWGKRLEQ